MVPNTFNLAKLAKSRILLLATALVLWASVTLWAFDYFWRIDAVPGLPAIAPAYVDAPSDRFSVLVFLHAKCPCSRATLSELSRVAAQVKHPVDFQILFITPHPGDLSWQTSSLYQQAAKLPNVTINADEHGMEAKKFGVQTSGEVIAYRPDGQLVFAGGITSSRGHEGDNAGKSRLLAALNLQSNDRSSAPVYGCRLPESDDTSPRELMP